MRQIGRVSPTAASDPEPGGELERQPAGPTAGHLRWTSVEIQQRRLKERQAFLEAQSGAFSSHVEHAPPRGELLDPVPAPSARLVILLHPPLPTVGVSIGMGRERQQNGSLANGHPHRSTNHLPNTTARFPFAFCSHLPAPPPPPPLTFAPSPSAATAGRRMGARPEQKTKPCPINTHAVSLVALRGQQPPQRTAGTPRRPGPGRAGPLTALGAGSRGGGHRAADPHGAACSRNETVILLHPPLPSAGVSTGVKRGCQQNGSRE